MVPEIHVTDENPPMFDLEWLDGCSEKIKFGGSGTSEILTEVNKQLSFKIRGEFSNKFRQQAMFELLGQDYAQLHFPHHQVYSSHTQIGFIRMKIIHCRNKSFAC